VAKTSDEMMRELFGVPSTETTEEPVVSEQSDDQDLMRSLFGVQSEGVPETEEPEVAPPEPAIKTSYREFYSPELIQREQELLTERMGPAGTGEFTQEVEGFNEQQQQELETVRAQKKQRYDEVQGSNVTDINIPVAGSLGKVITNPDGTKNYLPPPGANAVTELVTKSVSDTVRGVLSTPELWGGKGAQDIIPRVSSEDEAVIVLSEIVQLSAGGLGAISAVEKGKKLIGLGEKVPAFASFVRAGVGEVAKKTPQALQQAAQLTIMTADDIARIVPKGTVPSAIGMTLAADEDVGTFFGEPNMSVAEAKMTLLAESLALGVLLKSGGAIGEVTQLTPALKYVGRNVAGGLSAMFGSAKSQDEKVIRTLGEDLYNNNKLLAAAQTQEEINKIYLDTYNKATQAYKQITGNELDDVLTGRVLPDPEGYNLTLGEFFGDEGLLRLYKSLQTGSSQERANQILRQILSENEINRLNTIIAQQERTRAILAPRGDEATREFVGKVRPQLARETEEIQALTQAEQQAVTERTEAGLQAAQQQEARILQKQQTARQIAQEQEVVTAKEAQRVLNRSPVARTSLDDLKQTISENGDVTLIDDVLRQDLEVKRQLGGVKDRAYQQIVIPGEEAVGIVEDLIGTIANPRFLVSEAQIESANRALRKFINVFRKDGDEVIPTPGSPAPTGPASPLQQQLAILEQQLNDAKTAQEIMRISSEINQLLKSRGRPAAGGAGEVAEELPSITALDLEDIVISTRNTATSANQAALDQGSRQLKQIADGLNAYANRLTSRLDDTIATSPAAVQSKQEFDQFFGGFKERWRTATGKEWQGQLINAPTEADVADIGERIMKVFANPQAKESDLIQIRNIVTQMPDDQVGVFSNYIGTRIVADFTRSKGVMPLVDEIKSVKNAKQVMDRIDQYMQGTAQYDNVIPGAMSQLQQIRNQLQRVVTPAEEAAGARVRVEAEATVAERGAKEAREKAKRELDNEKQFALAEVNRRLAEAQSTVNKTALAKMLDVDDPTAYLSGLLRDQRGATKFNELWSRAGTTGDRLPSGDTTTQLALREGITEALLNRAYTPRDQLMAAGRTGLEDIAAVILREGSVPGRIFRTAYGKDPAGLEFIERLGRIAGTYQRSLTGMQVPGSRTGEVAALRSYVTDIQMVAFGPLTQDFRVARFLTRMTFGVSGADEKIAKAFGRVLTEPKYYTRVLDHAKKLAEKGLVPEEEAFSIALGVATLSAGGYKKYDELDDPREQILRDIRQTARIQQTEEMLNPQQEEETRPTPE
jgi:hypothetical protein